MDSSVLGKDALGDGSFDQQGRCRPGSAEIRRLRTEVKTSGEGPRALVVG